MLITIFTKEGNKLDHLIHGYLQDGRWYVEVDLDDVEIVVDGHITLKSEEKD